METIEKLQKKGIFLKLDDVVLLCKKYHIVELSIFGSSIRDDFTQKSDVDILVSFDRNSEKTKYFSLFSFRVISKIITGKPISVKINTNKLYKTLNNK
ncbi:MAG: nucleotidyltransferase domain-containing protein [Spirochaetes bacterium]|nr:nucleotidyltransferase domain-containing protein [Spirochaetota bacterium]